MSLYKRKDSSYWWIKITSPSGKRIQQSTGTEDRLKAQEYHDKIKAALWDEERLNKKPQRTWQEATVRWLNETSDKRTTREDIAKLRWLHPILGNLTLDQISLPVIDTIKERKLKEAGKATVNRYLNLVRAILNRAKNEWEWIDGFPKIKMYKESNNRNRSLTPEQADKLLTELPEHQRDIVLFALYTGLRQRNVLDMEWEHVDLELRHAYVPRTKNGEALAVPLNDVAMAIITKQIGKHPRYVFSYRGKHIRYANTLAWRKGLVRAGITDFRWHDLRHTWATWQRKAGTPTHELQHLGGWKTRAMVERYAHIAPEALSSAASRLDKVKLGYVTATFGEKEKGKNDVSC